MILFENWLTSADVNIKQENTPYAHSGVEEMRREEHLCYLKQLLVLLEQCKPTTYNRTFKKKKGPKRNTRRLKDRGVTTLLIGEKPKRVSFSFPSVSSVRGMGRTTIPGQGQMRFLLPYFPVSSPAPNIACMPKLFRLSFTGLGIQRLHMDEWGSVAAQSQCQNSSVFTL